MVTQLGVLTIFQKSHETCLSGGAAALRHQVDQGVAGLSQFCDGHSPSLSDEPSH